MYNIYENPWLLFSASMIVLVVVVMYRRIFPDKCRFWQLIIPFALMTAAFGIDHFVKTDREKIELTIKQMKTAAVNADMNLLEPVISPDYADDMFISKDDLLDSLDKLITKANIKRIKIRQNFIKIANKKASSEMRITLFMQPESEYAPANTIMFIEFELSFEKSGNDWLRIANESIIDGLRPFMGVVRDRLEAKG